MDDSIVVSGVGKAYKQYVGRFARLAEWLSPFGKPRHQLKWVLHNITFNVARGEALGIVGINGAGKSTLLKMIVGTTRPTTGNIALHGTVAALLELGMGFHPDFTGRQNVYMAGQLLGLKTSEVREMLPQIEEFAEIGDYIDQPVRVYSSGMQVRLAFSLATANRPDLLIVDEALSVGDAYFQHKCFERIREFRKLGTTLLLVSHDKQAIISICDRVVLINEGKIDRIGEPEMVMDYYNALLADKQATHVGQVVLESGRVQTVSGSKEVSIQDVDLLNSAGISARLINVGEVVTLTIKAHASAPVPRLVCGILIKDRTGLPVFGTNTDHLKMAQFDIESGNSITFSLSFAANLGPGSYSIAVALTRSESHQEKNYEWRDLALVFSIINSSKPIFVGSTWLDPHVEIARS